MCGLVVAPPPNTLKKCLYCVINYYGNQSLFSAQAIPLETHGEWRNYDIILLLQLQLMPAQCTIKISQITCDLGMRYGITGQYHVI